MEEDVRAQQFIYNKLKNDQKISFRIKKKKERKKLMRHPNIF